jgi:hypothetical protein
MGGVEGQNADRNGGEMWDGSKRCEMPTAVSSAFDGFGLPEGIR